MKTDFRPETIPFIPFIPVK